MTDGMEQSHQLLDVLGTRIAGAVIVAAEPAGH